MARYAKIEDGIVTRIISADKDYIDTQEGTWVKTSYNMRNGVYYDPETLNPVSDQSIIDGDEARERKNYATLGGVYDAKEDVFLPMKRWESWVIDKEKWDWKAPVDMPEDGKKYFWDEENLKWDEIK